VRVTRVELRNLRRFTQVGLAPGPALNLITGANGAGKTSVLEALHLMAYGRSFRGRVADGLVRHGSDALEVFVEWQEQAGPAAAAEGGPAAAPTRSRRAGLRHSGQRWEGRLDGADVAHLGDLCAALVVVTVEPGSHALIAGTADTRRRFVDWGLFHVEPGFLPLWRRYARALKQRNALLKRGRADPQMDAWEHELANAGELISQQRQGYLEDLQPVLARSLASLLPAAGDGAIIYQPGWRQDDLPLADALLLARDRDLLAGFTSVGPHRADWRIDMAGIPGRTALSRGQAKLSAVAALLAQAEHHAALRGEWPIMAFDDLASELDQAHQRRVLQRLVDTGAQVFITGTEAPAALATMTVALTRFHVEHGQLQAEAGPQSGR
jgi:DNA replication and repair protein RecF